MIYCDLFSYFTVYFFRYSLLKFPAAGNANNGSMNNVGNNGYVWSSSLNSSNVKNGRYLNFNSNNVNVNNNNRYYGQSVRSVVG